MAKTTEEPGTDIVPADEQAVMVREEASDDAILQHLVDESNDVSVDSGVVYRRIIQRILEADTPEQVLTPTETAGADTVIGEQLLLQRVSFLESQYEPGKKVYAAMELTRPGDDTVIIVVSGHQAMCAQLVKLAGFGQFPYKIVVYQAGVSATYNSPVLKIMGWE